MSLLLFIYFGNSTCHFRTNEHRPDGCQQIPTQGPTALWLGSVSDAFLKKTPSNYLDITIRWISIICVYKVYSFIWSENKLNNSCICKLILHTNKKCLFRYDWDRLCRAKKYKKQKTVWNVCRTSEGWGCEWVGAICALTQIPFKITSSLFPSRLCFKTGKLLAFEKYPFPICGVAVPLVITSPPPRPFPSPIGVLVNSWHSCHKEPMMWTRGLRDLSKLIKAFLLSKQDPRPLSP